MSGGDGIVDLHAQHLARETATCAPVPDVDSAHAHIESRLDFYRLQARDVLMRFDRHARIVDAPAKAPVTCKDPDDQKFIDLAVAHQTWLLSKDHAVLKLRKRLQAQGVPVARSLEALAPTTSETSS